MFAEFKHSLRRLRGRIIGWSVGLVLYGLIMVMIYDTLTTIEGIDELFESYPPEMMAFFGGSDFASIGEPRGYLGIYYFSYMVVIIGIFIVAAAAGLIAGDEEKGTLDLVMAHPISRSALYWGRLIALVAGTIIILFFSWLSWVIASQFSTLDLTWLEFLRPFFPLLGQLFFWGALALILSLILPSSRMAAMLSAALILANFLMLGLANLNESLESIIKLTPLYHDQGADAIDGIDWTPLLLLTGITLLLSLVSWHLFRRRDIRVGGERSWSFRQLFRRDRATHVELQGTS